jgi:uncharacterized protein
MRSAGEVIREARRRAGLSQAELARRAGVSQPVISAYEAGRREPGMKMLAKLVEASGNRLIIEVAADPSRAAALPDTPVGRRLRRLRDEVVTTAARRGATNVRVFGSVARGEDTDDSDIDILVDLDAGVGLIGLIGLGRELEEILGRRVDVVPARGLKADVAADALAEAVAL